MLLFAYEQGGALQLLNLEQATQIALHDDRVCIHFANTRVELTDKDKDDFQKFYDKRLFPEISGANAFPPIFREGI